MKINKFESARMYIENLESMHQKSIHEVSRRYQSVHTDDEISELEVWLGIVGDRVHKSNDNILQEIKIRLENERLGGNNG